MKLFIRKFVVFMTVVAMMFAVCSCGNSNPDADTPENDNSGLQNGGGEQGGGSEQNNGTQQGNEQGNQDESLVASFEPVEGYGLEIFFYSDNTWTGKLTEPNTIGITGVYESGTYTGTPAQDGTVTITGTKMYSMKTHQLEDCEPDSCSFTIIDGVFAMGANQPQYYIRKAKEITIFTTISADEDWIVYKFYDNNTYRLYVNSYFSQTGTYENGNDPCADGEITMDAKYTVGVSSTLEPYTGEPYTTSISNNIWTVNQTQTVLRELSVFTATVINELVPSFKETVSVRFLADNKFMITKTFQMVDEIVIYYGTYTGNPCPGSEGSQEVTLTFTKKQEYEQNPQGFEDIEVTDIQTETITIQNNKFTSTDLYPNLEFTRK